ncbi:hypothetical protein FRC06_006183, partial [Ceratobasidium sp. 370]
MASRKVAAAAVSGASSTRAATIARMKSGVPGDPVPPVDSSSRVGTPVPAPAPLKIVPTTPSAARGFLLSQTLLEKKNTTITPALLLIILASISKRADVGSTVAALIDCVALLLPEAIAIGTDHSAAIAALEKKVDVLVEQGLENGELPACIDPTGKLLELEGKLEELTKVVEMSQVSARAAETAAVETQKSLIELHQELKWEPVPARGKRGAVPPGQPEPEEGAPTEHAGPRVRPVPAKQAVASVKRAQAQGTWITVQPVTTAVADNLSTLTARSLVTKAETALDICWKALVLTSDFKDVPRPRINFV